MRIFLDTANIDHIKQATKLGVISGVTTNPSLVSKEGATDYEATIKEICSIIPGPISTEVVVEGVEPMIEQARQISTWAPNIAIKIPATTEGLEVTSVLAREGITVNFTLCFSLNQALLGALAGATYVSPFVGRLDDLSQDGLVLVDQIVTIYNNYGYETEVIVASVRNPLHVLESAMMGADIATIPFNVLAKLAAHPMTDKGIKAFLADWEKTKK